jgi:hypothetical protein
MCDASAADPASMPPTPDNRNPDVEVATLLGTGGLEASILCLESLHRNSTIPFRFRIHEDGTLTEHDLARLEGELPVARVVRRAEADRVASERLRDLPECRKLRETNVLALKLFDIVWFEKSEQLRYVDSDVLFLRPFSGPPVAADPDRAVFFPDLQSAYSLRFWQLAGSRAFRFPQRVNTGLFTIAMQAIDFALVERFLAGWKGFAPMWIEQTCWALTAGARGSGGDCELLDETQFRIHRPAAQLDPELVALHFVSPVRGDLARIAAQEHPVHRAPVAVRAKSTRRLGAWRLLFESIARRSGY